MFLLPIFVIFSSIVECASGGGSYDYGRMREQTGVGYGQYYGYGQRAIGGCGNGPEPALYYYSSNRNSPQNRYNTYQYQHIPMAPRPYYYVQRQPAVMYSPYQALSPPVQPPPPPPLTPAPAPAAETPALSNSTPAPASTVPASTVNSPAELPPSTAATVGSNALVNTQSTPAAQTEQSTQPTIAGSSGAPAPEATTAAAGCTSKVVPPQFTPAQSCVNGADASGPITAQLNQPITGEFTFYSASGNGACGYDISTPTMTAAVSKDLFSSSAKNVQSCLPAKTELLDDPVCINKCVQIQYKCKTLTVPIDDQCVSCATNHVDLSKAAFDYLEEESVGVATGATITYIECPSSSP